MTPEELFSAALGLSPQWRVAQCRFEGEPKRLELRLEHVPGEHFECPHCKALCGVHDTIERRWRHLNFFQYRCELVAKVPRTWCVARQIVSWDWRQSISWEKGYLVTLFRGLRTDKLGKLSCSILH